MYMKAKIIQKDDKSVRTISNVVHISTRENPIFKNEIEIVIYGGGHIYAYNTKYYDVVVEQIAE